MELRSALPERKGRKVDVDAKHPIDFSLPDYFVYSLISTCHEPITNEALGKLKSNRIFNPGIFINYSRGD